MSSKRRKRLSAPATSWDPLARWYDGWVGKEGSEHHRRLAIPAVMELLDARPGEQVLDLGAGTGVLAPFVVAAGAQYTGVDASEKLLQLARQHHGRQGRFLLGDAGNLPALPELEAGQFDAVVFLLSIQDMDPLDRAVESAAWALRPGGRVVILMTHPCFRVARQSGWGWDEGRKLQFRRVDRYLTPLAVPLKAFPGRARGVTRSFHRPLKDYVNALGANGLFISRMLEIPGYQTGSGAGSRAEKLAHQEFPLFLALRAWKVEGG